jgi:hypothetical protein
MQDLFAKKLARRAAARRSPRRAWVRHQRGFATTRHNVRAAWRGAPRTVTRERCAVARCAAACHPAAR